MANSVNRDWKTVAQLAAAEQNPGRPFELVTSSIKFWRKGSAASKASQCPTGALDSKHQRTRGAEAAFRLGPLHTKINNHGFVTHEASA